MFTLKSPGSKLRTAVRGRGLLYTDHSKPCRNGQAVSNCCLSIEGQSPSWLPRTSEIWVTPALGMCPECARCPAPDVALFTQSCSEDR